MYFFSYMPHQKLKKVFSNQAFIKILGTITLFLILTPFFKSSAQVKNLEKITPTYFSASPSTLPNISSTPTSPTPFPEEPEEFPFRAVTPRFHLPSPTPEPKVLISSRLSEFFLSLCIVFIANSFLLSFAYLILKKAKLIKSWQFLKYIFFVTIGEALLNSIVIFLLNFGTCCLIMIVTFELPFLLGYIVPSGFYTYWLSRRIFNLDKKQAIFVGLIIGISNFILPKEYFKLFIPFFWYFY